MQFPTQALATQQHKTLQLWQGTRLMQNAASRHRHSAAAVMPKTALDSHTKAPTHMEMNDARTFTLCMQTEIQLLSRRHMKIMHADKGKKEDTQGGLFGFEGFRAVPAAMKVRPLRCSMSWFKA